MNPYTIREANRRDIAAVVALWKEMMDFHLAYDPRFRFAPDAEREFARHVHATLRSSGARVFIAESGGETIGYILGEIHRRKPIYPIGNYGFISDIAVTERWRRRGVGRALVQSLFTWFRRQGVTAIELFVAEANPISTAFWRGLGFGDYLLLLRKDVEQEDR
jgi:ribosomal protein S18 acetylase RimI-like enzyme